MIEQNKNLFSWQDLWVLAVSILALFAIIWILRAAIERYMVQNRTGASIKLYSKNFELFYTPIACLILTLGFIAIDPIWHGLFTLIIFVFTF